MNATLYKQRPSARKAGVEGYIISDAKSARFFNQNHDLVTSLEAPELKFISADSLMLRGFEPAGFTVSKVQKLVYQEWLLRLE